MIISCLLSQESATLDFSHIDKKYYGTIFQLQDLENYMKLKKEFDLHRKNYFQKNIDNKGVIGFYKNVIEYVES